MDQVKLYAFIDRIIRTSPTQQSATLALSQLRDILSYQLSPKEMEMMNTALQGVGDSLPTMKEALSSRGLDEQLLRNASERAKQKHLQEMLDAQRGRC